LECYDRGIVPGSMALAVEFAWNESVAARLVVIPVPAMPVCVTVSHPGTDVA